MTPRADITPTPDTPLCFGARGVRTWGHFAADTARAAALVAGTPHVANLLADRYAFMVGLSAALLNGQTTILPGSRAAGAVEAALDPTVPASLLGHSPLSMPRVLHLPELPLDETQADPAPLLAALRQADADIRVFTSGSTGTPNVHVKTWGRLAAGAAITDDVFRRAGLVLGRYGILGTTPHQHMYGLEAAVFTGLSFGHCLQRGHVFYPDDLAVAVEQARAVGIEDLVLVTSPAHLKFLEPALLETPAVRLVLSATAPLPVPMAERLEARGDLGVYEIYGSTETGTIAWRRPSKTALWTPGEDISLHLGPETCATSAPHLEGRVPLGDLLELASDGRFRLMGRRGDMIHVAGKRTSLGALNAILIETPGLGDAVVLRERTTGDDRLTIVAVPGPANMMSETALRQTIRQHLLTHVDPVFVPRQIRFVEALPRTATGKIAATDLTKLVQHLE